MPPDIADTSFIYGDPDLKFTSCTFLGQEYHLMLFNILTWAVFDLWVGDTAVNNPVISALMTYLFDQLLRYVRSSFGAINVNQKTLVDDRFLL